MNLNDIMTNIQFKLEYLNKFQIITKPCSAIIRVSSDVTYLTSDINPRYLVNLNVITNENLDELLKRFGFLTELNYTFIRDLLMTGSIFKDKVPNVEALPVKGDKIIASFDYINDKLKCVHLSIIPREQLPYVDLQHLNRTQELYNKIKDKIS